MKTAKQVLPDVIRVTGVVPGNVVITMDGKHFPYYLAPRHIRIELRPDEAPVVWLPVLASRVETDFGLPPAPDPDGASP